MPVVVVFCVRALRAFMLCSVFWVLVVRYSASLGVPTGRDLMLLPLVCHQCYRKCILGKRHRSRVRCLKLLKMAAAVPGMVALTPAEGCCGARMCYNCSIGCLSWAWGRYGVDITAGLACLGYGGVKHPILGLASAGEASAAGHIPDCFSDDDRLVVLIAAGHVSAG